MKNLTLESPSVKLNIMHMNENIKPLTGEDRIKENEMLAKQYTFETPSPKQIV